MPEPVLRISSMPRVYPLILRWPTSPGLVVIAGKWERKNGSVVAWYDYRDELEFCNLVMEALAHETQGQAILYDG